MKLIDILEKDRENLLTEIAGSESADKVVRILENQLDKILMTYNEQCTNDREREAAAFMMQSIRFSLPLLDSVGETKVWETGPSGKAKGGFNPLMLLFLIGGLILCGIGLLPLITPLTSAGSNIDYTRLVPMELGGIAAVFLAGLFSKRRVQINSGRTQRVEIRTDQNKIYRSFRNAIMAADQNLSEIRARERWNSREEAGLIDGHTPSSPELDLFSDLLTAAYSRDPEYMQEKIDEIKYYLHRQQIEVVDYSEENARYFDMMPGISPGTIRPAMVAEGSLLKKGIASAGQSKEV